MLSEACRALGYAHASPISPRKPKTLIDELRLETSATILTSEVPNEEVRPAAMHQHLHHGQ
jgi:hypothetical protein